ncbi:probable DNA helicase MCM9 isoform X2 [Ricinus communis]|uniref:probable DNA helicase MCM9 isoform X2 n=1 Tax=Ricinus communis TaxID=3988 RepID=UPI00201A64B0|nr:probable DNA helicase MCM9 isoform X2 [Ricinus communis]
MSAFPPKTTFSTSSLSLSLSLAMASKETDDEQPDQVKALAEFLIRHYSSQLRSIVLAADPKLHYPLFIHFAELMDENPLLSHLVFSQPTEFLRHFDKAALWAHKIVLKNLDFGEKGIEKKFIHVRINVSGSPLECPETFPSIGRVRVKHRGILLTLKGTVIRSGAIKMYEGERMYRCRKCKQEFPVYPELESRNSITLPSFCPSLRSKPCEGARFDCVDDTVIRHDYQEIKIQESTQVLGVGVIPRSIPVILTDDLVDIVKAGDDVIVTGILTAKWSPDLKDVRCNLDPVLVANHVRRSNELKSDIDIPRDVIMKFEQFWSDLKDTPLKVALTLIGGVQHVDASGTKIRGESHLLLVGDPGTGKSQFLKFAAKLSNRSVITTGLGSTGAGLTVTAVKDGGEWMLEAGALVLADGGLCCIDEFDSMRGHDRATIHEAMEQQTISVAKAGLVTTLSTRTIVFGATNPKGQYDPDQTLSVNTALSGPLLSRFDIVLVLLDTKNPEWDAVVSSHILAEKESGKGNENDDLANIWTLAMLRRYIHFVKGYFKPILTTEAEKIISSYYQLQRRSATDNAARTTVRMLESLIRLAQAHARLMFRNEVTTLDAIMAILCIESSMTTSAIVDSIGNALHSNFTENPDQEYMKQERLILAKLRSIDESSDINITERMHR